MTLQDFQASLDDDVPPAVSDELRALWHAGRGEWDTAHQIAQDLETTAAARVHAYLHRVEGDLSNAHYWYRRAGQPPATDSVDAEWRRIVTALLK